MVAEFEAVRAGGLVFGGTFFVLWLFGRVEEKKSE